MISKKLGRANGSLPFIRIVVLFLCVMFSSMVIVKILQFGTLDRPSVRTLHSAENNSPLANESNIYNNYAQFSADLSINKTALYNASDHGIIVTYTIEFHNDSSNIVRNITISDTISSEMINVSYSIGGPKLALPPGRFYSWEIEKLGVDRSEIIVLTGEILRDTLSSSVTNTVEIQGEVIDIDQSNNVSSVTIPLLEANQVEGIVWYDKNRNGYQDENGHGVKNVEVRLLSQISGLLSDYTTHTDENGLFSMSGIPAGVYYLQFITREAFVYSNQNGGEEEDKDSDVNSEGYSDLFALNAENAHFSVDAGLYSPFVFLPIIFSPLPDKPDLTVINIEPVAQDILVTIQNRGVAPVTDLEFWVHLYVNPQVDPGSVNQLCIGTSPIICDGWITWLVKGNALPLVPGEKLTLSLTGINQEYVYSSYTSWLQIQEGQIIFAQVDAANANNPAFGNVIEIDELLSEPYNNIECVTIISNVSSDLQSEPCSTIVSVEN